MNIAFFYPVQIPALEYGGTERYLLADEGTRSKE